MRRRRNPARGRDAEIARLCFFLDGETLSEEGEESVMRVGPRRHALACNDAEGRTAKVSFERVRGAV